MDSLNYKKEEKEEEEDDFDAGFQIPDTKSISERLEKSALQQEHRQEMEKEEKEGKKKNNNKKRQKQGGTICYCGAEYCRIGPFVEKQ